MRNYFVHKIVSCFGVASIALAFSACSGDNTIEVINNLDNDFDGTDAALSRLDDGVTNIDFIKCAAKYNENRCTNFYLQYGSFDNEKIADLENYNDQGDYVGPEEPEVLKYLTVNKALNLTVTSYKQTVDSISETEMIGDPEVKFLVKTYSEDELVNAPSTALVLDTTDVKKWSGTTATVVFLPRGVDKIEICPIVIDENEIKDEILSDGNCITVKDIGLIENKAVFKQTETGKKFEVSWTYDIFEPEE